MFTRKPASDAEARLSAPLPQPKRPNPGSPSALSGDFRTESSDPTREEGLVVIGKGTRVQGNIGDCRRLDVQGILEADVVADFLVIREGGGIKGTVQCDNAKVHGIFEGTLVVHDHLELENTGNVTGEVSYRTLAIQSGARLRGNIVCSEQEAAAETEQAPAANVIALSGMFQNDIASFEGSANGRDAGT